MFTLSQTIQKEKYVVVIGAANIDIGGTPLAELIPADSNPGKITVTPGGVGRNIAHDLVLLGLPVRFITAVGSDFFGEELLRRCERAGMDVTYSLTVPDANSSMYMYINNEDGDMELSIDQMDICRHITPEYIDTVADVLESAAAVVVDGNIPSRTIRHITDICSVPVFMDPVSTALALRIRDDLAGLHVFKPNRLEAEYLTGMTINTPADYRAAARELIGLGIRNLFISMGSEGILAADADNVFIVKSCPADVICTTGAGDAATAGIIWSFLRPAGDGDLVSAAIAANAAAAMTIEVRETNNPELNPDSLQKRMDSHEFEIIKL